MLPHSDLGEDDILKMKGSWKMLEDSVDLKSCDWPTNKDFENFDSYCLFSLLGGCHLIGVSLLNY